MVSVIGEFKQGFVTFFRQTKASAKPARGARHATGEDLPFPHHACLARATRVTRSCGAGKRDETPGTSPWEANSRVTYDDRCSTNERVR